MTLPAGDGFDVVSWHGARVRAYPRDVPTLVDNLDRGRRLFGGSRLLTAPEGAVTYTEFAELVEGAAERLAEEGLRAGDRLAVCLRNGLDIAVAIYACARAGLVFVGLPTSLRGPQWAYQVGHCGAALVLAHPEFVEELTAATAASAGGPAVPRVETAAPQTAPAAPASAPVRVRAVGDLLTGRRRAWRADVRPPAEESTYGVIYTSGTTGRPKAARLTHLATMQAAEFYRRTLRLTPDDVTAIHLPFSYLSGHITQLNPTMLAGGSAVVLPSFDPAGLVRTVAEHRVSFLDVVPSMFALLLREPGFVQPGLDSLRVAAFGGSPMPAATVAALRERLPALELYDVYGMTETAGTICCLRDGEFDRKPGSVGRPLPVNDVRVVDERGADRPAGEAGELQVRGPVLTAGYHGDEAATAAAIQDGWLRTGDLARVDADGYVYVLDRQKDVIIRGGAKVYSVELERVLLDHPAVAEAAAFGVPDPVAFELVAACVVPADGRTPDPAELKEWVRARLAGHAVPRHLRVLDTLPRNRTGKVEKAVLRERLLAELARPT